MALTEFKPAEEKNVEFFKEGEFSIDMHNKLDWLNDSHLR